MSSAYARQVMPGYCRVKQCQAPSSVASKSKPFICALNPTDVAIIYRVSAPAFERSAPCPRPTPSQVELSKVSWFQPKQMCFV